MKGLGQAPSPLGYRSSIGMVDYSTSRSCLHPQTREFTPRRSGQRPTGLGADGLLALSQSPSRRCSAGLIAPRALARRGANLLSRPLRDLGPPSSSADAVCDLWLSMPAVPSCARVSAAAGDCGARRTSASLQADPARCRAASSGPTKAAARLPGLQDTARPRCPSLAALLLARRRCPRLADVLGPVR